MGRAAYGHKSAVFAPDERGGEASPYHITGNMSDGVRQALEGNVSRDARPSTCKHRAEIKKPAE